MHKLVYAKNGERRIVLNKTDSDVFVADAALFSSVESRTVHAIVEDCDVYSYPSSGASRYEGGLPCAFMPDDLC